jgi:hypothetical protein
MPNEASLCVLTVVCVFGAGRAFAQTPPAPQSSMQPMQQMSMRMMPPGPLGSEDTRDGSGTSWLPDESPMSGAMHQAGPWMLMLHGNAFLQYVRTNEARGDHEVGSVNWLMGMAEREVRGGRLTVHAIRYGFELARLDSYSGRLSFLPSSRWALQVSAGHVKDAEARLDGTRQTVNRITASATYHPS